MSFKKCIKFGAVWCAPCRVLGPIFNRVSEIEEFKDVEFYDLDIDDQENAELVRNYQIRNVPTILCLDENNEVIRKVVGAVPEHQLVSTLRDIIYN